VLNGPGDHVGDGVAVSATVVSQSRLRAYIPAFAFVGTLGIDDYEAVLFCQFGIGGAGVVSLCCSGACISLLVLFHIAVAWTSHNSEWRR
jgi:hypothetical protein